MSSSPLIDLFPVIKCLPACDSSGGGGGVQRSSAWEEINWWWTTCKCVNLSKDFTYCNYLIRRDDVTRTPINLISLSQFCLLMIEYMSVFVCASVYDCHHWDRPKALLSEGNVNSVPFSLSFLSTLSCSCKQQQCTETFLLQELGPMALPYCQDPVRNLSH